MKYRKEVEAEMIRSWIPVQHRSGVRVIDFGGEHFYDYCFPNSQIVALNNSPTSKDIFFDFNGSRLSIKSKPDISLCTMVLEHLLQPFTTLGDIIQSTKIGGFIFLSVPNPNTIKGKLAHLFFDKIDVVPSPFQRKHGDLGHVSIIFPYQLRAFLEQQGCTILHESYCGGTIPLLRINVKYSKAFGKNYCVLAQKL
jgi:hypothetical protein